MAFHSVFSSPLAKLSPSTSVPAALGGEERASLIAKRVEHDLDAIVRRQIAVADHLRADDPLRLGIETIPI